MNAHDGDQVEVKPQLAAWSQLPNGRRVGTANIRIQLLSISMQPGNATSTRPENGDESGEADQDNWSELVDAEDEETSTLSDHLIDRPDVGQSGLVSGNNSNLPSRKRSRKAEGNESGNEDQNDGHNRRRTQRTCRGEKMKSLRFACPYQAYEPGQDCLKPGPLNPQGGCDGIRRLRYEPYSYE